MRRFRFSLEVDKLVKSFFDALENNDKFRGDTKWHSEAAQKLNREVFCRLDELQPAELRQLIADKSQNAMMIPRPNHRMAICSVIDSNFAKVRRYLRVIRDFTGDPKDIDRLLDRNDTLYIKGARLFFITQLLAGAHLNGYVVFEDHVYDALQDFDIIHLGRKIDTGSQYMCINAVCGWMYKQGFEEVLRLKGFDFGLVSVHNFLWHYHKYYKVDRTWY